VKTISLKKVTVVAVASLGFGLLSVVPASAAQQTTTAATADAVSTTVGTATAIPVKFGTLGGTIDAACVLTFTLSAHTGLTIAAATVANTELTASNGWTAANSSNALAMTAAGTYAAATAALTSGKIIGNLNVTPTLAGVYTGIITTAATTTTGCTAPTTATSTFTLTVGTNSSIAALTGDGGTPTLNNAVRGVAGPANSISAELILPTTVSTTIRRLVRVSDGLSIDTATLTAATGGTQSGAVTAIATDKKSVTVESIQDGTAKTAHGRVALKVMTPTVGVHTITVFTSTNSGIYDATAAETITVTVSATASTATLSVGLSSSFLDAEGTSSGTTAPAADEAVLVSRAAGTAAGVISLTLKDALDGNMPNATTVSAVVTGPGLIAMDTTLGSATYATASRAESGTISTGATKIAIYADGTAGVGTITISVGTTVVAVETVTFFGTAAKLTAGALRPHVTLTANSGDDAVWVLAVDTAGNLASYTPTALSSDASVIQSSLTSCNAASAAEQLLGAPKGSVVCNVTPSSVGAATLTIAPASTTTNSPTVAMRVTKAVAASVALSTNKATYAPGEKITLTITAKDADGYLLGYGAYGLLNAASTVSQNLTGTVFADTGADVTINAGVATTTYYAPLIAGPFTFAATVDLSDADVAAAIQGAALTATATVTDANQSSILTQIDALNAKIVALNALIAKIMKKLGVR